MVRRRSVTLPDQDRARRGTIYFSDKGLARWLGHPTDSVSVELEPGGMCVLSRTSSNYESNESQWSLAAREPFPLLHRGDELVLRLESRLDGTRTVRGEFGNGAATFVRYMWQRADAGVGRRIAMVTPPGLLDLPKAKDFEHAELWRAAARDVLESYIVLSIGRLAPLGFERLTGVQLEVVSQTGEGTAYGTEGLDRYAVELIAGVVRLCGAAHDVLGADVAPLDADSIENALRTAAGVGVPQVPQ